MRSHRAQVRTGRLRGPKGSLKRAHGRPTRVSPSCARTAIGEGPTFWIFAVVCVLGLAFVARYVPETRNRNYEQIDAELRSRWQPAAEVA